MRIHFLLCSCISDDVYCRPVTVGLTCPSGDISLKLVENVIFYLLKYSDHKTKRVLTETAECSSKVSLLGQKLAS